MNSNEFCKKIGIKYPIIGGAMYPCTDPELVSSVSKAGGIGIIQPLSFTYVHKISLKDGIRQIKDQTDKPFGFNALIEKTSKHYEKIMMEWVDIALEEGCRFFVTSLGKPDWVVKKVHACKGLVFHDVTERKWAQKALDMGVDGLICVNSRAGGHAGNLSPQDMIDDLKDLGVPLVCAGGIGNKVQFKEVIDMGYAGVQMGTRFIATQECKAADSYKQAIIDAKEEDVIVTNRVTGVPLAVIATGHLKKIGPNVGPVWSYLLRNSRTKHWVRTFFNIKSLIRQKKTLFKGISSKDYWSAGKSVAGITEVIPAGKIVKGFGEYQSPSVTDTGQ